MVVNESWCSINNINWHHRLPPQANNKYCVIFSRSPNEKISLSLPLIFWDKTKKKQSQERTKQISNFVLFIFVTYFSFKFFPLLSLFLLFFLYFCLFFFFWTFITFFPPFFDYGAQYGGFKGFRFLKSRPKTLTSCQRKSKFVFFHIPSFFIIIVKTTKQRFQTSSKASLKFLMKTIFFLYFEKIYKF